MNPTIAKYREALKHGKTLGSSGVYIPYADLAALLDIAEAADAVVTNWMGSSVAGRFADPAEAGIELAKIRAAIARINGDKP